MFQFINDSVNGTPVSTLQSLLTHHAAGPNILSMCIDTGQYMLYIGPVLAAFIEDR